ncbi:MAG TPA: DNA mismatch repair protein MutS [Verrucomicrobiae bacterium]|nr:DNA mismatch repair protein MutS [Verrucomicrobiae bacterium]
MKAHLLYRDRDSDMQGELRARYPYRNYEMPKLVRNEDELTQDLELKTLFRAMAGDDDFLYQVSRQAVLSGLQDDIETILYRQAVLKDCLRNEAFVRTIYDLAVEAIERQRRRWLSLSSSYPSTILYEAGELLRIYTDVLGKLLAVANEHAHTFESDGFTTFFRMLKAELTDDYFAEIRTRLRELKFRGGVLVSAELGRGNQCTNYVLRYSPHGKPRWIEWIFSRQPAAYTYRLADRDEAGARALSEMRHRGINLVANAAAQSADHMLNFFATLRTELAFYLGCMNLHRQLAQRSAAVCYPAPVAPGSREHSCVGLRDACLVLTLNREVIGNEMEADGKSLVIITGANQGGKSTFLRGIGLAQLMMQCGMFVAAESFRADICRHLFTHYRREEDATMTSGKFDEELKRMSAIADTLKPDSLLLFNESFAATNEREGSEIARQIIRALLETRVKIFFVTHQYGFAHGLNGDAAGRVLFLRAERQPDGTRTYKLLPGEPLETSFGVDLYKEIFTGAEANTHHG